MRKRRRVLFILLTILSATALGFLFFFIAPDTTIPTGINIPIMFVAFPFVFLFIFSLFAAIFSKKLHGLLAASFVVLYLLLRMLGFVHPLFFLLLASIFLMLELFLHKR